MAPAGQGARIEASDTMRMNPFPDDEPNEDRIVEMLSAAMTLDELAERLGICPRKARDLVDKGDLAAINVGSGTARKHLRIIEADFQGFLTRRRIKAPMAVAFEDIRDTRPKPLPANPSFAERRAARKARAAR